MTLKYKYDKVALKATVCGVEECGINVVIPATVEYYKKVYKVTSIGDYAFRGCSGLTSVEIPNSVTSIEEFAFYDCEGLKNVTIGNSVTSIGDNAFSCCYGLTSVQIGNSVRNIGESAFHACKGLTSIVIPNSVTSIGNYAFAGCPSLESVVIGNSVTSIGGAAFSGCSGLTSVVVDGNNTKYDSRENCNAIIETETNTLILGCKNTEIPNSVTSIGSYAFYGCKRLTSIVIPNSVTSIGGSAFCWCKGLTSIVIPNSVTSIGDNAFSCCTGLTSVVIPSCVEKIHEYAFGGIPNLQVDIYNEEGEVLIHPNAFYGNAKINYLGKKKVKEDKTTKVEKTSNETNDKKEEQAPVIDLDKLIDAVVADGVITDKEHSVILKKATAAGYDADEVEILLDGKLAEKQNAEKVVTKEPKKAPAKKEAAPVTEVVTPEEKSGEGGRNYSKYSVNGAGSYGKGRMVEAVVKKYVELNPATTVQKLKEVFPERLQGSNFIKDSTETITDMKRYYEATLPGGAKFYISNQWGTQTDAFMEYVNSNVSGIKVTKCS